MLANKNTKLEANKKDKNQFLKIIEIDFCL